MQQLNSQTTRLNRIKKHFVGLDRNKVNKVIMNKIGAKRPFARLTVFLVFSFTSVWAQSTTFEWTFDKAKKHAEDQQDSTKWDLRLLRTDGAMYRNNYRPIQVGSFPVVTYDSPGNGNCPLTYKIGDKTLSGQAVFVGKGVQNKDYFTKEQQVIEVSFILLSVSDSSNTGSVFITSRNHPHYLAEGKIPFKNFDLDWVSMQLADRNAYAIVNMKLFDLRLGRLVLVSLRKDDTMRFLQVNTSDIFVEGQGRELFENVSKQIKTFVEQKEVKTFLNSN